MIDIDLSKQKAFDADPRAIQQINFTENLQRAGDTTIFFVTEEVNVSQNNLIFINMK